MCTFRLSGRRPSSHTDGGAHQPFAVELIDDLIISGAMRNRQQRKNASFVQGKPAAILVTELRGSSVEDVTQAAEALEKDLANAEFGQFVSRFVRRRCG